MKNQSYLWVLFAFCLTSCGTLSEEEVTKEQAYQPIYKPYDEIADIKVDLTKKLDKTGKIYVLPGVLLISEYGAGVHIFDNSNPKEPKRVSFISIPATQDVELKGETLYADNGRDLVSIDISDIKNPRLVDRVKDVFPYPMYPPFEGVKFECPDPSKGYVVDWVLTDIDNPKCSR